MRRFLPLILIEAALLIDTSVVPVLTMHWAVPSVLLVTVSVLGLLLGRTNGLLYGMISGLLYDIVLGYPLGMMAILFAASGYISGIAGRKFQRYLLTVVIAPALCAALYEVTMAVYMIVVGQMPDVKMIEYALVRILIETVLAQFMYLLYNRMLKPTWSRYAAR